MINVAGVVSIVLCKQNIFFFYIYVMAPEYFFRYFTKEKIVKHMLKVQRIQFFLNSIRFFRTKVEVKKLK